VHFVTTLQTEAPYTVWCSSAINSVF